MVADCADLLPGEFLLVPTPDVFLVFFVRLPLKTRQMLSYELGYIFGGFWLLLSPAAQAAIGVEMARWNPYNSPEGPKKESLGAC